MVTQGLGPNAQPLYTWDEFGFRVEEEDGPEDTSSKLLSIPFTEVFLKHDDDAMKYNDHVNIVHWIKGLILFRMMEECKGK